MTKLVYYIFYCISLLPFRGLYILSDIEYFFVYRLFGYRRKVVRRNLATAFPEKKEEELRSIERRFYHWFCDYFFEAMKLLSISDDELRQHFRITNPELFDNAVATGQNVAAFLGHYGNWEYLSTVSVYSQSDWRMGLIYDPLHSKAFDYLFRRLRTSQPRGTVIPKKDILRQLITWRREGTGYVAGYIADQAPKWQNIHCWLPFLHHDTPVFTGAERITRKLNNQAIYVEMARPRRGYYTATYHLLSDNPAALPEHELTRRFFQCLEETIQRDPVPYLWTHNRWKRTHEEFDRRFQIVHGKVIEKSEVPSKPSEGLSSPSPSEGGDV